MFTEANTVEQMILDAVARHGGMKVHTHDGDRPESQNRT